MVNPPGYDDTMRRPPHHRLAPWFQLSERTLASYSLFELRRVIRRSSATGAEHSFLRLLAPDWVNVIPITADGLLVLVEQFRHGTDRFTLEIPGGVVDEGETPAGAAARELEEETGFRAGDLHRIGDVRPNPAFLSNTCWTFLALDCRADGVVSLDPSEEIAVHLVELEDFTQLIDDGAIDHSLVIAAHDHLQRGRRRGEPWAGTLRFARNAARGPSGCAGR